jgi:hypothetical protein
MKVINMVEENPTLDVAKFPFLGVQKKSMETLKNLIELLNNRVKLINNKTKVTDEFEINENKINLIKTDIELAKLHTQVIQKEKDIKEYTKNVFAYLKEIEEKWQMLMEKAEKKAKNDKVLAELLEKHKGKDYESNLEHKIGYYIEVKSYIYPSKTNN